MAAVSLSGDGDRSDRAQLVLVTGLALAISLVAIALVLNSAIYTHNLASRYDSPGDGVAMANGDIREGVGAQIRHANNEYNTSGYSTVNSSYQSGLPDVEAGLASDAAVNGRLYRVSAASDTEGVRIVDADSSGSTFVDRQGSAEWTVVSQAQARSFRIAARTAGTTNETTSNVLGGLLGSDVFTVAFDDDGDGTDDYRVAIYENGDTTGTSDISVTVENVDTGTERTCTVADTRVVVDFTRGTLDGEPCNALAFLDDLSAPYDVRFVDGDEISGSYRLVADARVDAAGDEAGPFTDRVDAANYGSHCAGPTFYDAASAASGEFPRISPAIYAATVDVTYDSPDITYEGVQRVAPGEAGDAPTAPRITEITVTDNTNSNADFDVDVDVADPNGDLASVTVELVDGSVLATDTDTSISGSTASSSLSVTDLSDSTFTVRITVTDAAGNSRTVEQRHQSDGATGGCPA